MLLNAPQLHAVMILRKLQDDHPGQYPDSTRRNLERRVRQWRATSRSRRRRRDRHVARPVPQVTAVPSVLPQEQIIPGPHRGSRVPGKLRPLPAVLLARCRPLHAVARPYASAHAGGSTCRPACDRSCDEALPRSPPALFRQATLHKCIQHERRYRQDGASRTTCYCRPNPFRRGCARAWGSIRSTRWLILELIAFTSESRILSSKVESCSRAMPRISITHRRIRSERWYPRCIQPGQQARGRMARNKREGGARTVLPPASNGSHRSGPEKQYP